MSLWGLKSPQQTAVLPTEADENWNCGKGYLRETAALGAQQLPELEYNTERTRGMNIPTFLQFYTGAAHWQNLKESQRIKDRG